MKKFLLIAIAFFAFAACDDEDTSDLRDELKTQGDRLEMLENEVEALKLKIEGLNQTYKAVSEMLNGGLITNVEEVTGDDGKSGCKLTIQTVDEAGTQINTYTIWNGGDGKDGEDGENGTPGSAPQIGVEQEEATGLYYWTLDGEPMVDADGKKIYATAQDGEQGERGTDGVTPQLKIEDNTWKISYDGSNWEELGVFSGTVTAGSNIQVVKNGDVVVIKQAGKADIEIPLTPTTTLGIEFTNIDADAGMSIMKNSVYVVKYEPKNAENATVKVEMLNGTDFEVENLPGENKFKVTAKGQDASDVVLVHVYDGTVCMHTSFNITSTAAITDSKVVLPLEANEVIYPVQLTLPEAITGEIAIITSLGGTLPAGAVTLPETVTVSAGQGTFDVVIDRSSLTSGLAYTLQLVFSKEDADYEVLGAMEMLTGTFTKITLSGDNYVSSYSGTNGTENLSGSDGFWESKYQSTVEMYGDPTYGVYIDVTLPDKIVAVQFKYNSTNGNGPKKLAIGAENGVWTLLGTQEHNNPAGKWPETSGYAMPDNSAFGKVRFGITQGNYSSVAGEGPEDGTMTGYLGGGRGGNTGTNYVRIYELQVFGLQY
ncbi:MAG: DUF4988 domain-containing protein [Odoribacter sp.]|nr:DUF4988 domain-containing protein [Odoribacter sp.]